jgi:hypothetical protein
MKTFAMNTFIRLGQGDECLWYFIRDDLPCNLHFLGGNIISEPKAAGLTENRTISGIKTSSKRPYAKTLNTPFLKVTALAKQQLAVDLN